MQSYPFWPQKAYRDRRGMAPRIPNLGTGWRSVVYFTPWPLYPWFPLNMSLGLPKSRPRCLRGKFLAPSGIRTRHYRVLAALSQLVLEPRRNTYLLTPRSRVLLEKLTGFAANHEIPPHFMEPESSSPYSQAPATCPYPELTPSSPHNPFPFPEDPS